MSRGLRLKFADAPVALQCSTGKYGVMSPAAQIANSGASGFSLSAGFGSYALTGQSATLAASGSLAAVTGLRVSKQGDTTNGNLSANNHVITITWNTVSGASSYVIKRGVNGGTKTDYDTSSTTSYTDIAATNAYSADNIGEQSGTNTPTGPTTVYDYDVCAVDGSGGRGPDSADCQLWCYMDGTQYAMFQGSDLSFGMSSVNFSDTTLTPPTGTADIKCTITGVGAGFQPPTFSPGVWTYGGEVGAFNFLNVTCKPINSSQAWNIACLSRGPPGDVFPHVNLNLLNYGPAPQNGVWATYKVPLSDFMFGQTVFTGSISGGVLTVASITSGPGFDTVGWIDWAGIVTPTWISATPSGSGTGTYTVTGTSSISSRTMTYHRTNLYKFQIVTQSGVNGNSFGVTNIYFSRT